jgi:Phasin protein
MANRNQRTGGGVEQWGNVPLAPNTALTAWCSLLTGATNAQAVGEIGAIASEWQTFVGRRLKEDVDFLQRLTRSAGPDQVVAAYADFWRKAGEDYGNEIATMTKLMADMTSRMAVAAQSATEEASTRLSHREAA